MRPPFSTDQFLEIFRRYHEGVWPVPLVLMFLASAFVLLTLQGAIRGRWVTSFLALLWLWMGLAYHWTYFTDINPWAVAFGAAFVLEGAGFLLFSRGDPAFGLRRDARGIVGGILLAYALVLYPLIGSLVGHRFPAAPTFGLPCPTTIYTFGILLWANGPVPRWLVVIPAAWSLLGTSAVFSFGMTEDLGLLVAGLVAAPLLWTHPTRREFQLPEVLSRRHELPSQHRRTP